MATGPNGPARVLKADLAVRVILVSHTARCQSHREPSADRKALRARWTFRQSSRLGVQDRSGRVLQGIQRAMPAELQGLCKFASADSHPP